MAATRRPGRPRDTDLSAVLDAASELDLTTLTSTAVAAALGVTEGTVRFHAGSAARLRTLTSARIFDSLELEAPGASSWQEYLLAVADRYHDLLVAHPGVEAYVNVGPYEASTLASFQTIIDEIIAREPTMTPSSAHLVGSRVLMMTALTPRSPRVDTGDQSPEYRAYLEQDYRAFQWGIEAFLAGAEIMIADGRSPDTVSTPERYRRVQ